MELAACNHLLSSCDNTLISRATIVANFRLFTVSRRCHSGLVPPRHCSGGTNLLAYLFPRSMSASGSVPPGTVARPRKRSGSQKCSVWLNVVDARSGFMKTVQISLRMLLWTDSLCGAAEIVLCTYRILFYIDDLYFLSCRTLYTALDNETLLGLYD